MAALSKRPAKISGAIHNSPGRRSRESGLGGATHVPPALHEASFQALGLAFTRWSPGLAPVAGMRYAVGVFACRLVRGSPRFRLRPPPEAHDGISSLIVTGGLGLGA